MRIFRFPPCQFAVVALWCCIVSAQAQTTAAPPAAEPQISSKSFVPDEGFAYHLIGFALHGSKRVDLDALTDALPQHEGDTITAAQIEDDTERIRQALKLHHVSGDLTTMLMTKHGPGHHVWVLWNIQPQPVLSQFSRKGQKHFGGQSFTGNTKLDAAQLATATDLHPGEKLWDRVIGDARTGIEQAYDKPLHGASVQVTARVKVKPDNTVFIDWHIAEPK